MALFENFPYTNFHDMNMDWLLKKVKELGAQVAEFEALLENGPVADVKTQVSGTYTTIKDSDGIALLPGASDTTAGVVTMDISDHSVRIAGAEAVDVPVLTAGKIDASQLPPTVEPATANTFGTVKLASSGSAVTMTGGAGAVQAAALDANGDIGADVIPASGATAGTYAATPSYADAHRYEVENLTVGADGRVTGVSQNPYSIIRSDITSIPAGSYTQTIDFDTAANYPWYNNGCFVNVNVYEYMANAKGVYMLNALVHGTDYTYNIYRGYLNVTLTAARSNPVYIVVNGSYGRRSM